MYHSEDACTADVSDNSDTKSERGRLRLVFLGGEEASDELAAVNGALEALGITFILIDTQGSTMI